MKKKALFLIAVVLFFVGCVDDYDGRTTNVTLQIKESSIFSDDEINSAIETIKASFTEKKGCTLTLLSYDEKESLQSVKGFVKDSDSFDEKLIIEFKSNFTTGNLSFPTGLVSNSEYEDWRWILSRESIDSEWKVEIVGY